MNRPQTILQKLERLFNFLLRVVRGFIRHEGLLLSGAVAYYTLLSVVPLSILALVVLTNFTEEQQLILTLPSYLGMMVPGYAATLTEQAQAFLEHRKVIGIVGFFGMLFFSSTAFPMPTTLKVREFAVRGEILKDPKSLQLSVKTGDHVCHAESYSE